MTGWTRRETNIAQLLLEGQVRKCHFKEMMTGRCTMMVQTLGVRVVILELVIYLFMLTDCFKLPNCNKGFCDP